jgi:hypothetical protein
MDIQCYCNRQCVRVRGYCRQAGKRMEGCYTQHDLWYGSGSSSSHDRRVCVSGGADDCAGRARSGKSVLSCPRENEREGVHMHEATLRYANAIIGR